MSNDLSLSARLRRATPARVALGAAGPGLPTQALLDFQLAAARAKDAVHAELDVERLGASLGRPVVAVRSRTRGRDQYLSNPDLGRRLLPEDADLLRPGGFDLAIVLADGLSATATERHGPPLALQLAETLRTWRIAPIVAARQSRVALGDEIAARLDAEIVVILIGERPGLSAPDSLGAYITYAPRIGRTDAERNCVSNIRTPDGLSCEAASERIVRLLHEMKRAKVSGVRLGALGLAGSPAPIGTPPGA